MRRRIGVSQNNILQGDNLQINNGSTASVSFNFTGESDLSFNLPGVDGSSGWALKTDGLGNLSFGTVSSTGGGATPSLQSVTTIGNTTSNNIEFGSGAGIFLNNGSKLREGSIDAGNGGSKGIAQICSIDYELKWEAGRLYVMNGGGTIIRQVLYNFSGTPSVSDDSTKGYAVGSLWTKDDNITYVCTDATSGSASWDLYDSPLRYITEVIDPTNGFVNIEPTYAVNITSENLNLNTTGLLTINSSYALPVIDGTPGDVLTTDGVGTVLWLPVSSGTSGTSGTSGLSITGATGANGTNGVNGTSGTSGLSITGANGTSGTSGTSGVNGATGPNGGGGSSGTSGTSGVNGSSGTSGVDGSVNATGTNTYVAKFTGATALGDSTITNISNETNIGFSAAYVRMTSDASRFYYQVGTNSLQFSGNVLSFGKIGTTAYSMRVDTVNDRVQFPDGSAATPSITFGSDLDTGIYRAGINTMRFTAGGTDVASVVPQAFATYVPILASNGSSATPSISFISDTDTGIYMPAANQVGIAAGGGLRLLVGVSQTQVQNVLAALSTAQFVDGSAATPSITFTSETGMGLYRQGTNNMGLVVNATEILRLNQAQCQLVNGSQGVPSIAFINSATTGMYRAGTNIIGFSSGGVLKFTIAPTYISSVNPHWFSDGSVSAPAITFNSETTTGFYRVGAGKIGISNAGVTNSVFGTTNSISAQTFFDKAVNHTPTTNASVSGTYSLDMSASNIFILTLTGNTVLTTTNRNVGSYMVYIKQDGTGGRTFNLSTDGQFLGATAISIGTASNAVSILQLICVGTQSVATSQKNLTSL